MPYRWPEIEGLAIIKLARQHFNTEQMPALLDKGSIRLGQQHFQNDVYSKAGSLQRAVHTLQSRWHIVMQSTLAAVQRSDARGLS